MKGTSLKDGLNGYYESNSLLQIVKTVLDKML